MSDGAHAALEPLVRPLRFAAGRSFANLSVVKDLERTLRSAAARAKASAAPGSHEAAVIDALSPLIEGLDSAAADERADRVRSMIAIVDAPEPEVPRAPRRPIRKDVIIASADPLSSTPISKVKGVGPKTAEHLAEKGIRSVLDALLFLPSGYEDRRKITPIADLHAGEFAVVRGKVLQASFQRAGKKRLLEVVIGDGGGTVSLRWFHAHQGKVADRFVRGREVLASGTVTAWGAMRQMVHPEVTAGAVEPEGEVVPIYPAVPGVPPRTLRRILQNAAREFAASVEDPVPGDVLTTVPELLPLGAALGRAHLPGPSAADSAESARRRLVFDELFFVQLALARRRAAGEAAAGFVHAPRDGWEEIARSMLPFALTGAQRRVVAEIAADLAAPRPMNRLLQGDVGSGKTAVAMIAAAIVAAGGRQAALLAPTEILAEQHAASAARLLGARGLRSEILTGSTRPAARRALLEDLATGRIEVLIGTHALIEPEVHFRELGLCIVDEQHRFGVEQRAALREKGRRESPDMLVMTATPIPRTLALTLYGDLRVSVIDELPPGRTPVSTRVFRAEDRPKALARIQRALESGRQAYVIFPLVEESEVLDLGAATSAVQTLAARYPAHRVGLLHGRMRSEEKSAVMHAFRSGEIAVLVSTTVVEVGVDVPNATVILIENAERFGLSQLHQLRGRIGRGAHPGECLLLATGGGVEGWTRVSILERTSDGFEVAEADLAARGPGDLLGIRQSGLPELSMANLARDGKILEIARDAAIRLLSRDPTLEDPAHLRLASELTRRLQGKLQLATVG